MPRFKKTYQNSRGFTLVELVLAIAVIGAISAVSVSVINPQRQQNRANDATILSALTKSKLSAQAFVNSYGRYPNEQEFFESLSGNTLQKDGDSCEIIGAPDNECLFNISGINPPSSCDEDGWFGDETDINQCFFRYKGGIDGQKDRFRISVKTHGLINNVFVFDNKLEGNVYKCPWPHTDNKDFEDCTSFNIDKITQDGSGDGVGGFLGGLLGGGEGEEEQEVLDLELTSVCSNDPDLTRRWRVKNENPFELEVFWNVVGTTQAGQFMAPKAGDGVPPWPGSDDKSYTFFETATISGANTTKIWWYDFDLNKHETVKASGGQTCEPPYSCDDTDLDISTDSIPNAQYGEPYSTTFLGNGGKPPYLWNIIWEDSTLPGEFILNQSSGVLSGTPYGHNVPYPLWVRLADGGECTVDKMFSLTVERDYDCSESDLYIVTNSVPEATSGESYSTQVYASGGFAPYTWEIVEEETTVPGYLTIDQSWGYITGTPEGDPGTYTLTLKVQDSEGCSFTNSYSFVLNQNLNEGMYKLRGRFINKFTKEPIPDVRLTWPVSDESTDYFKIMSVSKTKWAETWADDNGYFEIDLYRPETNRISIISYLCSYLFNDFRIEDSQSGGLYKIRKALVDEQPHTAGESIDVYSKDYDMGDVELWPLSYAYFKSDIQVRADIEFLEDHSTKVGQTIRANYDKYLQSIWPLIPMHTDTKIDFFLRDEGRDIHSEIIRYNHPNTSCGGGEGIMIEFKDGEVTYEYGTPPESEFYRFYRQDYYDSILQHD